MKKVWMTASVLTIFTLLTASAFAWGPGKGSGGPDNCPGYSRQANLPDLTAEQKEQLQALRQKFTDDTYSARLEKHQKRDEMRMLMETSNPDPAKLKALSAQIADLQKEISSKRIDFLLEAKKIAPELGSNWGKGRRGNRGFNRGPGQGGCARF